MNRVDKFIKKGFIFNFLIRYFCYIKLTNFIDFIKKKHKILP